MNIIYKYKKQLILLFLISIAFCFLEAYTLSQFRVTSTDPSLSSVSNISPYLRIYFNKTLSPQGVDIIDQSNIDGGYQVQGDYITIIFKGTLSVNHKYTLIISHIYDSSGKELSNLKFAFTPQDIAFQSLSNDQQAYILKGQSKYESNINNNLIINGSDYLINNGLSTTQLLLLTKYFKEFMPSAKIINVSPNGIGIYSGGGPGIDVMKFNVSINGVNYNADGSYTFLTNLTLTLYNSTNNNLVFNSSTYSSPGGD